jgi:oligopeptide/dipeptide ABC transporter ATP-binding protein
VETGPRDAIFASPRHPYTLGLMGSVPRLDRPIARLVAIPGSPPSLPERIDGCPFAPRCPRAHELGDRCVRELPPLRAGLAGQVAYCHLPEAGSIVQERSHAFR